MRRIYVEYYPQEDADRAALASTQPISAGCCSSCKQDFARDEYCPMCSKALTPTERKSLKLLKSAAAAPAAKEVADEKQSSSSVGAKMTDEDAAETSAGPTSAAAAAKKSIDGKPSSSASKSTNANAAMTDDAADASASSSYGAAASVSSANENDAKSSAAAASVSGANESDAKSSASAKGCEDGEAKFVRCSKCRLPCHRRCVFTFSIFYLFICVPYSFSLYFPILFSLSSSSSSFYSSHGSACSWRGWH